MTIFSALRASISGLGMFFLCAVMLAPQPAATGYAGSGQYQSHLLEVAWIVEQLDKTASDPNLCAGGLENGKQIVAEPYLRNPFKETTRLGCEVDGGRSLKVPDLPAPDDRATRLA